MFARRSLSATFLMVLLLPAPLLALAQAQAPAGADGEWAAAKPRGPAYERDPHFQTAMAEARAYERQRKFYSAVESLKKANKLADGACASCLETMYKLQNDAGDYKAAAQTAAQMVSLATTPREKSRAETRQGLALLREGGEKPKPKQLESAHAVFLQALADFDKNSAARYEDACVLTRMGRMEDAGKEFAACADLASASDPIAIRARRFAANPSLALEKRAPAFTVTALDGTRFTLDEMGGRVVLIDFWATWCGPCNEELPHLKKIAKEFAGEPLVILSISWDSDEQKWRDFIAKNQMTWMQYRDADHQLSREFAVEAIPHYFTIDSDGVLTAEMLGSGSDVEGKLKKLLKRAREAKVAGTSAPRGASVSGAAGGS